MPSSSLEVIISTFASSEIISDASTRTSLILPATVALARDEPMSIASSSTEIEFLNFLLDLSGRVISGIFSGDLY